ncbi:MAG: TerB N-terminal domain-containing protein [Thermomicrobiales bacterium]
MGFMDWLKKLLDPEPAKPPVKKQTAKRAHQRMSSPKSAKPTSASRPAPTVRFTPTPALPDDARWIRENEQVEFQGIAIRGGLLFIGSRLAAGYAGNEPSLIDPSLPVALPIGDAHGNDLPYWPAYATMSKKERGVYLRWLATGRRDPAIPLGYPFLFLYGIERRLLVNRASAPEAGELPAIRAELVGLRDTYGPENDSFRFAASQVIDLTDLLQVERAIADRARNHTPLPPIPPPPPLQTNNRAIPMSLRIGLGVLALAGTPVPVEWALAWMWYDPTATLRGAAYRCPEELAALFALRYRAQYGDGVILDPRSLERMEVTITPANATIGKQHIRAKHLPDVVRASEDITFGLNPLGEDPSILIRMMHNVTNDLDDYSRWLGRNRDRERSLSAWAMLPEPLQTTTSPRAVAATSHLASLLGKAPVSVIPGDALLRLWVGDEVTPPTRLTQPVGSDLARTIERLGYGIEPDPRSGVAVAAGAGIALFRLPDAPPTETSTPDDAYALAALLVDLAALVGEADGAASAIEFDALRDHLRAWHPLSLAEERRLGARLAWQAARPASDRTLTRMKKRVSSCSAQDRDRLAVGLLRIVEADGAIAPAELAALRKIWKLLGRDPDRVASDLHAVMTGGRLDPTPTPQAASSTRTKPPRARPSRNDDDPVIVRQATPETPGLRIPRPPEVSRPAAEPDLTLDPMAIARKIADTAAVSDLLNDLLMDESPPAIPTAPPARPDGPPSPSGAMLAALSGQAIWSADAFSALAAGYGMMPNAALDLLNELGFEHADDPLLIEEADGSLSVDSAILAQVREAISPSDSAEW